MEPLRATDRCDRCGAQAYVATDHSGMTLLWCVHHFTENELGLANDVVLDSRETLNTH